MKVPQQITVIQVVTILVSTIIGVGVLALPLFAVRTADSGAPFVTFLGTCLAFFGVIIITILGKRYPSKTIIIYSEDIIGKWLARIGSLLVIGFFAVLTSLTAREFGEVVVTAVLKSTPVEITVIVMLLLAAISTRSDIFTFTYIHQFYFPFLLVPVLVIASLSLKNAEMINLLPLWGNEQHDLLKGVLTVAALFQGSFILTMIIPAMRNPHRVMKASVWAMVISGGLYITIVVATVGLFGAEEIKKLLWPTLELAKATSLPANILERLDAAFLAVWVTAVFTSLLSSYYLTIQSVSKLLRLRDHGMFSFFLLPFVFVLAMVPQNIMQMYDIIEFVSRCGLMITILYPSVLLIVAIIRGKREDRNEDTAMDKPS